MNTQTFTLHPSTFDIQLCTWQEAFSHYLQTDYRKITHRQLSEKSIKLAMQHIRVFGLWHEDKFNQPFEPGNLTNYDLHLYRKCSLDQEKVKAATWNSRHWALGILCLWIGIPDLMDGVEQKSQVRASTQHRSLTDDEYHRLVHKLEQDTRQNELAFHHINHVRNWAAVSLMLHAGLRVEEVSLLTAEDITINERSGNVLVRNGKGDKEREIDLNKIARYAISSYLMLGCDSASLFDLTTRSLQRIVSDIGQRIGVPDLTPHWLRYTFAKRLYDSGYSMEGIRNYLGHESIETTRIYLRPSKADGQSAVERIA